MILAGGIGGASLVAIAFLSIGSLFLLFLVITGTIQIPSSAQSNQFNLSNQNNQSNITDSPSESIFESTANLANSE